MAELSARPLLASDVDAELFVDRAAELAALERSVKSRLNSLVVGERGSGKTSLLHQLERRLDEYAEAEPVFVEGARRAEHPDELLSLITYRLSADRAQVLRVGGIDLDQIVQSQIVQSRKRPPRSPIEQLLASLKAVRDALSEAKRRPVLILDELPSEKMPHALFGQFRDELWSLPATWVVAVAAGEEAAYLRRPANAFFESVVTLGPLDEEAALELLHRRTDDVRIPRTALRQVVAAGSGNPRRLVTLARESLLEGQSLADRANAQAARERRARDLGEAASRLVGYLEANGPASASDDRMLSELGWSRSRATQILRRLEEAGLVEGTSEHTESGRRKVYALKEQLGGARE